MNSRLSWTVLSRNSLQDHNSWDPLHKWHFWVTADLPDDLFNVPGPCDLDWFVLDWVANVRRAGVLDACFDCFPLNFVWLDSTRTRSFPYTLLATRALCCTKAVRRENIGSTPLSIKLSALSTHLVRMCIGKRLTNFLKFSELFRSAEYPIWFSVLLHFCMSNASLDRAAGSDCFKKGPFTRLSM